MALPVLQIGQVARPTLEACVRRFGAELIEVPGGMPIPGTFWGEPEAGLEGNSIYVRTDTPVHSLLHELSHFVCMSAARRRVLSRHAGGDADEECAVCCLQLLLAAELPGVGLARALDDMDSWGYSFREGSALAWWHGDARFAREWLHRHGLINENGVVTGGLRKD